MVGLLSKCFNDLFIPKCFNLCAVVLEHAFLVCSKHFNFYLRIYNSGVWVYLYV